MLMLLQRTKFPDDPRYRFTNIQKQLPAPFVVNADFNSILKPDDKGVDTTQGVEVGGESSAHVFQEHIPCSFAHKVVSSVDPNSRDNSSCIEARRGSYVICSRKLSSCLTSILVLQNRCCLLLQNCDRLTTLLPVIYAQNRLEMIKCKIIVIL